MKKIVSGGQTGVDRAALDAALDAGFPCGGWCPRGRLAEDGRIPDRYPLSETPSTRYAERTEWNVRDSDGTLILTAGPLTGGTALTRTLAQNHAKPLFVLDLRRDVDMAAVLDWIERHGIQVLNIAGPRLRQQSEIYDLAYRFVRRLLAATGAEQK
ncbi:MAG: molybdenum cofactor carrier [Planctomycetes bacterium]|nr:molybdenum cofactor carrier [Planctomycetota bacterium]